MSVPKKIHYFWAGNKISEENLQNIIAMKVENPGFNLNLWVNNKSLIKETFDSLLNKLSLGEVFGYEFDKVQREYFESKDRSLIKQNGFFIRDIREAFKSLDEIFPILESMFYRNINGYYHNYALASDIARLVILYTEGGIYLDVDVKVKGIRFNKETRFDNINKEAKFKNINAPSGMAFGDASGKAWKKNSCLEGNAILAAPAKSIIVFKILNIINDKIKDNLKQKYVDINKKIPNPNRITPHHIIKPIHPKHMIQLKNFANPGQPISSLDKNNKIDRWEGVSKKYPDWGKDTWCASRVIPDFRFDAAVGNTGPTVYQEYLKEINREGKPEVPAHLRFEENGTEFFEKVDAYGKWRNTREPMIQQRGFRYDDTEFPSLSNFILGDAEIRMLLKKLKWV